jgi:hypothetical protein
MTGDTDMLHQLAQLLKLDDTGLTDQGIMELIKNNYNDYYLKLKENREKLEQLMQEELSIALAGRAGS